MFKKLFPFGVIVFVAVLVFRDFIFKGLVPIPGDILIGAYFPWLDYKWGYPVAVPVKNPAGSDIISLLYPWRILGMDILKSGNLPLWDSTSLLGMPLLANFQAALLNPLNFLFWFFPNVIAWSIQVVLQVILISFTTYLFLRNLNLKRVSALFGGLAFAFSGFSIVWMQYNTINFALAFFPLLLLLTDKIAKEKKASFAFLLGVVICLQVFAGYPQIVIYTIIFSTAYFLYRVNFHKEKVIQKSIIYLLGVVTGVLLAAIQLIPSLELVGLSIRAFDNTAVAGGIQFLPLQNLLTLFVPDYFGNPGTGNYWGLGSFDNFAFFVPLGALYFALLSILSKSAFKRINFIFVIFLVASLLLSTKNPVSYLITNSDLFGLKSAVATRVLFVFDFAVAMLAAIELEAILTGKKYRFFYKILPLFIYLGLIIGLIIVRFYLGNIETSHNYLVASKNLIMPLGLIFLSIAAVSLNKFKSILIFLVFIILIFNVLKSTDKYLTFFQPSLLYPEVDVATKLKTDLGYHRFDREKAEIFPSNTWVAYGLKAASGQNALLPLSSAKYFSLVNGTYPNLTSRFVDVTNMNSPLYDTLDIKYIAFLNRDETKSIPVSAGQPSQKYIIPKLAEYQNFKTVRLAVNKNNLGLAWFSENINCQTDEKKTADILENKDYNPKNLIVVNCDNGQDLTNLQSGSVNIQQDKAGYTSLKTDSLGMNYLIISKAMYPGWKAFVDGKETVLNTANLALLAILVPAGSHLIELKYEPITFKIGLYISFFTLLSWSGYFILPLLVKKYNKLKGKYE